MPTLVVRHPDGSESEHPLSGELKIGRQEGNDLVLTEGGVSRRHARVWAEGGKVMVEDVGSANGTFVDGERIAGPTPLTSRSQVLLGDYELKLKVPARQGSGSRRAVKAVPEEEAPGAGSPRATRAMPSLKARQAAAAGQPSALAKRPRGAAAEAGASAGEGAAEAERGPLVLKGLTGPWANQRFPVQGKLVVGRQAPPATVLLEDDSVSRRHAEVDETPEGAVLRDMGSANGTQVNGQPIGTEEVVLQPGDIIQFGMVEMVLEDGAGSALVPTRRGGRGELAPRRGAALASAGAGGAKAPAAAAGAPAPRRKLLVVAASLVGLLLVVGILKNVAGGGEAPPRAPVAPPPPNPVAQVQELLSECRSYSSTEMGGEPKWTKAEEACSKALDIDPIHAEANSLMRRIKLEKEAAEYFQEGEKYLARLKEEEALDVFRKIPKNSVYFRRAKPKAREAALQVMKRAEDDCKRYLRDNQWSAAVPRCDRYMGFACQKMRPDELEPPLGFTLVLEKRRLRRNEWRPKDKLYREFLLARQKLDPNAVPWVCPVSDIFADDNAAPDPKKEVERAFDQRLPSKYLVAAMMDYWHGRGNEALATLQKVRSNYELAKYHGQADELLKAVSTVDQLFKLGQGHLQIDEPEKAAEPFREALEVDKGLMGEEFFESKPSFYRRNIQQDMAAKAVVSGKYWDDRGDKRRSCRIWKLGFSFYAGNTDLNASVGRCSTRGLEAFKSAQACEDLDAVLDFAVPGDGLEEKARELKAQNGC